VTANIAYLDESTTASWERTLYAFLAEKERRSGSLRTVQSYTRMLHDFFGRVSKTPDKVTTQDVFAGDSVSVSRASSHPRSRSARGSPASAASTDDVADVNDLAALQEMLTSPSPELAAHMEKHDVLPPFTAHIER
jgi:hypothetical protein